MPLTIRRYPEAGAFLERARDWLLAAEAENNLLLGLAARLTRGTEGFDPPIYLAAVEDDAGALVGCAFRTPPYKVGLTGMPAAAARAVADDVAAVYDEVSAVLGPERAARAFAERWAERHGLRVEPGMPQRIYRLETVEWPEGKPPGRMRLAVARDTDRLTRWMGAFAEEAGVETTRFPERAREAIRARAFVVWVDGGEPVSMAGIAAATPNGARVGYVYTPPELRGRGYATWCVARLSQRLLDGGKRFCFLYTDVRNATSNGIYRRIGYRPVCDVVDIGWRPA